MSPFPEPLDPPLQLSVSECVLNLQATWASLRENLLWGFPSRSYPNQPAELQRLARYLKFAYNRLRFDTFQKANNKGADQSAGICRAVCAAVIRKPRRQVLSRRCLYGDKATAKSLIWQTGRSLGSTGGSLGTRWVVYPLHKGGSMLSVHWSMACSLTLHAG